MTDRPTAAGRALVGTAIVLLALNLRPVANAMGAVMPALRADTGLSATTSGLLLAVPTLAFALMGLLAPSIARRLGTHRTVLLAIVALILGQAGRVLIPGTPALFAGSMLALAGIAIANVLMPGLVRLHFPAAIGPMTAVYTTLLAIGAGLSSGFSLPLARSLGGDWRVGLGLWTVLAGIAVIPWVGLGIRRPVRVLGSAVTKIPLRAVLRTPTARALVLYFGLQAMQAYVLTGWMPSILTDAGLTDTAAGYQVAIFAALGIPVSAVAPALLGRMRNPRILVSALTLCYLAGYLGLLFAPARATWLWASLVGLGGGAFPVALTLIALRARTPAGTTSLSAVTQSVGYGIASVGPVTIGLIHDLTGSWTIPIIVMCAILVLHLMAGIAAIKPRFIEDELLGAQPVDPAAGATPAAPRRTPPGPHPGR